MKRHGSVSSQLPQPDNPQPISSTVSHDDAALVSGQPVRVRRARRDKIALVLAGGGITGVVYEVGALRAIDDMLVDLSVNDFDIYVGTSGGALVSALMANGYTPHDIIQTIDHRHPELRGFRVSDLYHTNFEGFFRRLFSWPATLFSMGWQLSTRFGEVAVSDLIWELADLFPDGIYNGNSLERYMRAVLETTGHTNFFEQLSKELYIVATELDTGARAVFGPGHEPPWTISQAVAASSAVPLLYRPMQILDKDYVDGGLHGAASLDLAIEAGAKLVVCVNPMVPLDASRIDPTGHYIRRHGVQAVINQTVRTFMHSTIRYHIKNLRTKYPDVDIILIQPDWTDHQMFSYNPMYYRERLAVAEHGFKSVTLGMLQEFDYFQTILSRHNIRITKNVVVEALDELRISHEHPEVVQHIIERTERPPTLDTALLGLEQSLSRLRARANLS